MFCLHCGNRLPDDALFCNQCGKKVAISEQSPNAKVTRQFSHPLEPPWASQTGGQMPPVASGDFLSPTISSPSWQAPADQPTSMLPPGASRPAQPPWQATTPTGPIAQPTRPLWQPTRPIAQPEQPPWQLTGPIAQPMQSPWQAPIPTGPMAQSPWQASAPMAGLQSASPPVPPNALQRLLVRVFQPTLASNALFGVILGGIVAAIGGALIAGLLLTVAHAIGPHTGTYGGSESLLGIFPLHAPFRDSLQLFLSAHGVGLHLQYQYGSSTASISTYNYGASLSGLMIVPALLLIFAGYLAACTDFQNSRQRSLLRGAAIAIPYVILLFIMASQVNGCIPSVTANGVSTCDAASSSPQLTMDGVSLFILGVLWSVLFGMLGASLKLGRGRWRHLMLGYLRTVRHPQLTGMLTGGLAAVGLGVSLALLFVCSFLAYTVYSTIVLAQGLCLSGDWQVLTLRGIAQAPLHAVNLFFFSFGTPITVSNPQHNPCFYTTEAHTALALFGGTIHLPPWFFVLLAIPVISLFLGGRVSAAIGRVQGIGPGAVQGVIVAAPFTVIVIVLSIFTTITDTTTSPNGGGSGLGNSVTQSFGAGAFDLLLWGLLSGAVLGALGGMYQTSSVKTRVSKLMSSLLMPFRLLSKPGFFVLDRLCRPSGSFPRSAALGFLYSALLCALLLIVVAGVTGGVLIGLDQTLTLDTNQRIMNSVSVILVALPGLLLLCACAAALVSDPMDSQSTTTRAWGGNV